MSAEIVKKIDENFLNHGTREEFKAVILALLDLVQQQDERIRALEKRVLELENENRRLRGEKKSRSSRRPNQVA